MDIGALRQRVSIESVSTSQDAYGQPGEARNRETTSPFAIVWGKVQDLTGRDLYSAQQVHSQVTTRITIRFRTGVIPSMIAHVSMDQRTRTFAIMAVVEPDGRRRMLQLECMEQFD